jgi:predicted P-loop ATPase
MNTGYPPKLTAFHGGILKPSDIWKTWGLSLTKDGGGPHVNLHNAALILENDPHFINAVYFDEFLQRVIRCNSPEREWHDSDDLEVARYIQSELAIPRMSRDTVSQAVITVAHKNKRNCVQEWLSSLTWDGTQRLESFFPDHFGATQSDYTAAAGKNFWLSLVARAFKPGCKVDNMIVLEGAQGVGKSTALQIIAGDWFAEQHESATNPRAFAEILQGKLLIEISEMDAFSRAEVNRVKQTVSCPSDRFRASYGRYAIDHPRTCVFVGTTNRDDWNRDETGARRFWPIACVGTIEIGNIRLVRDQFFAEAVNRYKASETHWEMPLELAQAEQEARYSADPWQEAVDTIIKGESEITVSKILEKLDKPICLRTKLDEMRAAGCLRHRGWLRQLKRIDGIPTRVFIKPSTEAVTVVTCGYEKLL